MAADDLEIQAKASIHDGQATVELTYGEATLTLTSTKAGLAGDAVELILASEDAFIAAFDALANAPKES